jgi:hypothetical protein
LRFVCGAPGGSDPGAAPRGASSDGPPAPRRLEQPFPSHAPISDAPRHRRGHRLAGSMLPTGSFAFDARPFGLTSRRSPARPRPPTPSRLAERRGRDRDAFGRVSSRREFPRGGVERAHWLESAARHAHLLCLEAAATRVSTCAECSSASALPPRRALRLAGTSDAEMRRTDFCHFTFVRTGTRVSSVPVASERLLARALGEIACFTAEQFASAGRTTLSGTPRRALSSRRRACRPSL